MIANLRANAADYKKRAEEWMLPELQNDDKIFKYKYILYEWEE